MAELDIDWDYLLERLERLLDLSEEALERHIGPVPEENLDLAEQIAFRWIREGRSGWLQAIRHPDLPDHADLLGIDQALQRLERNTRQFLAGHPANNVLLWGERGCGKSTAVKGLLRPACRRGPAPGRGQQGRPPPAAGDLRPAARSPLALHPLLRRPLLRRIGRRLPGAESPARGGSRSAVRKMSWSMPPATAAICCRNGSSTTATPRRSTPRSASRKSSPSPTASASPLPSTACPSRPTWPWCATWPRAPAWRSTPEDLAARGPALGDGTRYPLGTGRPPVHRRSARAAGLGRKAKPLPGIPRSNGFFGWRPSQIDYT